MKRTVSKSPLLPAEEEIVMVKETLVLTVMMDFLEYEARKLRTLPGLKMPHIYTRKLRSIQDELPRQLHQMQRELKTRGVRIIETNRTKGQMKAHYLCRGYEYEMLLQGDTIKAEIEVKLAFHFGVDLTLEDRDGDGDGGETS